MSLKSIKLFLFLPLILLLGCQESVINKDVDKHKVDTENIEKIEELSKELTTFKNIEFEKEVDQLFVDKYFQFYEKGTLLDAQKSFVERVFSEKVDTLRVDRVNPFNSYSEWYIAVIQKETSIYREAYKRALEEKLFNRDDRKELDLYFGEINLKKVKELKRLAIANVMGNFYLDLNSSSFSDKKEKLYIDLKSDTTRYKKRLYIPMSEKTYLDLNSSRIKVSVEWRVSIDKKSLDSVDIFIDGKHHRAEPVGSRVYKVEL